MKDMIMKEKSPMGIPLKTNAVWCENKGTTSSKILYSGALNVTMGVVHKASKLLPLLLRNPTKEGRINFLRKFTFLSKLFLRFSIFYDKKMMKVPRRALKI